FTLCPTRRGRCSARSRFPPPIARPPRCSGSQRFRRRCTISVTCSRGSKNNNKRPLTDPAGSRPAPVIKSPKGALTNHWTLLTFVGGLAFAMLSGQPDVAIPLVLAGEAAYLGFLGTHPKFQRHVDAQEAKARRVDNSEKSEEQLRKVLKALPEGSRDRYNAL